MNSSVSESKIENNLKSRKISQNEISGKTGGEISRWMLLKLSFLSYKFHYNSTQTCWYVESSKIKDPIFLTEGLKNLSV